MAGIWFGGKLEGNGLGSLGDARVSRRSKRAVASNTDVRRTGER